VAIHAVSEILGLAPKRPAVRLVSRAWLVAVSEAAVGWIQDGYPFPADDMVELLMAGLHGRPGPGVSRLGAAW
jgi:hypothetical protein